MSRRFKTRSITIRVSPTLFKLIVEHADRNRDDLSSFIRKAIIHYLDLQTKLKEM